MPEPKHGGRGGKTRSAVISLEGVCKEYSLGQRMLRVLDGLSLQVSEGEFVAIMGPSGSGKSTLLQLLGCLDKPTKGRVLIDGEDVSKHSPDELAEVRGSKIGFVFQAFNLIPNLSALQNVEIALAINEVGAVERERRAIMLLERVGLSERGNHLPAELSGGEKQRVALARALANNPKFLLAGEPTGNLDSKSGEEVMNLIEDLWKNGATVVMVTHEPMVAQYSQRIVHVRDGKIEYEESPPNVLAKNHLKAK